MDEVKKTGGELPSNRETPGKDPLEQISASLQKVAESLEYLKYATSTDFERQMALQNIQGALRNIWEIFSYRTRLAELAVLAATANAALFTLAKDAPFLSRLLYVIATLLFIATSGIEAWQFQPRYVQFSQRDRWAVYIFLIGLVALVFATIILLFSTQRGSTL